MQIAVSKPEIFRNRGYAQQTGTYVRGGRRQGGDFQTLYKQKEARQRRRYGLKAFPDIAQDIHRTYGYLFFSEETACLALLELSRSYEYPADVINMTAVKNAVFQNFPDYMIQYNQNEISGQNDGIGRFYQMLGMDVELSGKEENLIALTPDVGTEYLII